MSDEVNYTVEATRLLDYFQRVGEEYGENELVQLLTIEEKTEPWLRPQVLVKTWIELMEQEVIDSDLADDLNSLIMSEFYSPAWIEVRHLYHNWHASLTST